MTEKIIKALAICSIVYGSLLLVIESLLIAVLVFFISSYSDPLGILSNPSFSLLAILILAIPLVYSIFWLIGGIGALKRKDWARIILIILAILTLVLVALSLSLSIINLTGVSGVIGSYFSFIGFIFYLPPVILSVFILVYFFRQDIKKVFN